MSKKQLILAQSLKRSGGEGCQGKKGEEELPGMSKGPVASGDSLKDLQGQGVKREGNREQGGQ